MRNKLSSLHEEKPPSPPPGHSCPAFSMSWDLKSHPSSARGLEQLGLHLRTGSHGLPHPSACRWTPHLVEPTLHAGAQHDDGHQDPQEEEGRKDETGHGGVGAGGAAATQDTGGRAAEAGHLWEGQGHGGGTVPLLPASSPLPPPPSPSPAKQEHPLPALSMSPDLCQACPPWTRQGRPLPPQT